MAGKRRFDVRENRASDYYSYLAENSPGIMTLKLLGHPTMPDGVEKILANLEIFQAKAG